MQYIVEMAKNEHASLEVSNHAHHLYLKNCRICVKRYAIRCRCLLKYKNIFFILYLHAQDCWLVLKLPARYNDVLYRCQLRIKAVNLVLLYLIKAGTHIIKEKV